MLKKFANPLFPLGLAAGLMLSACVVPIPIPVDTPTRTVVVGERFPVHPDPGPSPVSSRCKAPARASAEAAKVIASVNAERRARGLSAVRASSALMKVAQGHACDNAARSSISHSGSDGSSLATRMRRAGFRFRVATENTGLGFASAERAMAYWMGSSGHRANILNPGITEIGMGLADGARPAWVLVMGKRQ